MARPCSDSAIPLTGEVDPLRTDVQHHKPKKRKPRAQPPPHPDLAAWKLGAERRIARRVPAPMVMVEPDGNEERLAPVHNDERLHDLQLAEAFGTRSSSVIWTFLRQLNGLCTDKWWDEKCQQFRMDEHTFNTVLAIVNAVKPKNEMEAAFAAQMVAVHMLSMKVAARAIKHEWDNKTASVAGKLARTFTMQMQELRAMRGKTKTARQTITVKKELHQHVHYHDARGVDESGGQSHGRRERAAPNFAEAADDRGTLPSSDESGRFVPLPRRSRSA